MQAAAVFLQSGPSAFFCHIPVTLEEGEKWEQQLLNSMSKFYQEDIHKYCFRIDTFHKTKIIVFWLSSLSSCLTTCVCYADPNICETCDKILSLTS